MSQLLSVHILDHDFHSIVLALKHHSLHVGVTHFFRSTPTAAEKEHNGDSTTSAAAGVHVGAIIAVLAVLAALGLFLWHHRRNGRTRYEPQN